MCKVHSRVTRGHAERMSLRELGGGRVREDRGTVFGVTTFQPFPHPRFHLSLVS